MTIRKLIVMLFLLTLIACDKEEKSLIPIDSTIQIEVKELVTGGASRIVLIGKTEKEYTCFNYTIATSKKLTQHAIEITFGGLEKDDICATAVGPATTEIDLGMLSNGEYTLQLNTATAENEGLLKVTASEIILELNQQDGIDIVTPVVQR